MVLKKRFERLNQIFPVSSFRIWLEQNDMAFYLQNELTEERTFPGSAPELGFQLLLASSYFHIALPLLELRPGCTRGFLPQ